MVVAAECFLLACSLYFVAVILEPDLHLSGTEIYDVGEAFALVRREITLLLESLFQLVGLMLGEQNSPLSLLGHHD